VPLRPRVEAPVKGLAQVPLPVLAQAQAQAQAGSAGTEGNAASRQTCRAAITADIDGSESAIAVE